MQGPIPWWDQPPDSRDNTVSMPRVDPAEFVDRQSGAGSAEPDGRRAMPERPAFGDPYALPAQAEQARLAQPASEQPTRWLEPEQRPTRPEPDFESAASFDPDAAAPPEPEAAEPPDQEADARAGREADARTEPEAAAAPEPAAPVAPRPEATAAREPAAPVAPRPEATVAPRPEAPVAPRPEATVAPEPEATVAPRPEHAVPRVGAAAASEPTDGSPPEPVAWTTPETAPADTTAVERARTAAGRETSPRQGTSAVQAPDTERIAPIADDYVADRSWRDAQSAGPAASASLAPTARSAHRPMPEHQTVTEVSPDVRSVPAGAADRPAAGSIADLRGRLARLPAGHPASPYDDTGRPRPAPTRLRMLELGLPARPAGVASYADPPGFDHDDEFDDLWPAAAPAAPAAVSPAPAALGASDTGRRPAGERDAATQPSGSEASRAGTQAQPRVASPREDASPAQPASSAATAPGAGTASGRSANGTSGNRPGTRTPGSDDTAGSATSATGSGPFADNVAPLRQPAASGDGTKREARARPAEGSKTSGRQADAATTSGRRNGSGTAQSSASAQNGRRGPSAPADWQRPYDVPADSDDRRDGPAPLDRTDLTTASWPTIDVTPPSGDRQNGNRTAEFRDPAPRDSSHRQARRSQPWPADPDQPMVRPPVADRPSRPAVANRLSPAERELVDRILAACRAAEGRNAVGGYGSSGLTPAMMRIAAQLPFGGLAPGSEQDTLKSADRLAAKLARLLGRQPGRSAEQVAASIGDAIRYTFTFDIATYTEGTLLVHRKLKTQGFELEARRNRWDSPEYKGVFTRWRDPAHGLPFEVQFHTGQSWTFVKRTHETYVRITDPATSPTERANLRAQQATAAEVVQQPPGCTEIDDFRAGAREQPR